jgi:hypothetical protein
MVQEFFISIVIILFVLYVAIYNLSTLIYIWNSYKIEVQIYELSENTIHPVLLYKMKKEKTPRIKIFFDVVWRYFKSEFKRP